MGDHHRVCWRFCTHQNNDHYALDFKYPGAGDYGEPIMTAAAGKVTRAGWSAPLPDNSSAMDTVYVDHGDGYVSPMRIWSV